MTGFKPNSKSLYVLNTEENYYEINIRNLWSNNVPNKTDKITMSCSFTTAHLTYYSSV